MLLENKVAVVYGAGGSIGGAVARTFAREGAEVFLAGRTKAKLDKVAEEIRSDGGVAETAQLDALDEHAVNAYVDAVAQRTGRIDISFNLISLGEVFGSPLVEMSLEDFSRPITTATRTQFLTTRAAARHMIERGSGVILAFGGTGETAPELEGFTVGLDAVEGLRRQWACELGPHGVRVVTQKTGGVPETLPEDVPDRDDIIAGIEQATLLKPNSDAGGCGQRGSLRRLGSRANHDRRHCEHLLRRARGLLGRSFTIEIVTVFTTLMVMLAAVDPSSRAIQQAHRGPSR
jgi:3-oxoacyl-[acyl-carrier protein] reductase